MHAVEADPLARAWAERNVSKYVESAPYTAGRVMLHAGDFADALGELDGTVDLVISNPPYIPVGAFVEPEVSEYDPLADPGAVERHGRADRRPRRGAHGAAPAPPWRPGGRRARRATRGGGVLGVSRKSQAGGTRATTRTWSAVTASSPRPGRARGYPRHGAGNGAANGAGNERSYGQMSMRYDCRDPQMRTTGIDAAVTAARGGELIVLPTDTVYGIGADAFTPSAVITMLAAKGRGRNMPPPGARRHRAGRGGASGRPRSVRAGPDRRVLARRAHPGVPRQPDAALDLGDTKGTVALRMPLHSVTLDVLKQTGPLAVSSANRHGQPAATSVGEAEQQLGEAVSVYLDGGPCADNVPVDHPRPDRDHTQGAPGRRDLGGPAARRVVGHRGERALRGERGPLRRWRCR